MSVKLTLKIAAALGRVRAPRGFEMKKGPNDGTVAEQAIAPYARPAACWLL